MTAYEELLNRRKWFKENSRKLRNEINSILKRDHTINADSYMRNKEVSKELEIFFANKTVFVMPGSTVNSIVSSLVAIGLLVSVLTPTTLKGVYMVDALITKLESMRRVINNEITECETKYPALKNLYNAHQRNKVSATRVKIQMNSLSGMNYRG